MKKQNKFRLYTGFISASKKMKYINKVIEGTYDSSVTLYIRNATCMVTISPPPVFGGW